MKVVLVNCFDTYENRVDLIHEFFINHGYDVTVVQSNFRHFKKNYRTEEKKDFIFVETKAYFKNLSPSRLYSHYKFSRDSKKKIEEIQPDIIYALIPPNSLTKFMSQYKKKNPSVKLIFDLIDLWPETMPIGKIKELFPFTIWKEIRNQYLKYADFVVTECDLYKTILEKAIGKISTKTLYLAKKDIQVTRKVNLVSDEINLAYLGSINNIIDIPKIKEIIEVIVKEKPVTLHIVGDGESRNQLIEAAESAGSIVKYYGKIYNPQEKQDLFDQCDYGLNVMKESVCVGLTMKSVDYFQHGLPIINNIPGDTERLVGEYGIGINLKSDSLASSLVVSIESNKKKSLELRNKTLEVFEKFFSVISFNKKLNEIYKELMS